MQEILAKIWNYALPIGTGVTIGAIFTLVAYICIKAMLNKFATKLNLSSKEQELISQIADKVIEKLKGTTINGSLEKIAKSELQKITEVNIDLLKQELSQNSAEHYNLILILEKLASYFDNSIGVGEDKKQELKLAIENAKSHEIAENSQEIVIVEETLVKTENNENLANFEPKTSITKVVR